MNTELLMAVVALTITSGLSSYGLIMNYKQQRRANRILVSSRLSNISEHINQELMVLVNTKLLLDKLSESEERNEHLKEIMQRMDEIQELNKEISETFKNVDKEDPVKYEEIACYMYTHRMNAERTYEQIKEGLNDL